MKLLITGASGFIGSALVRLLCQRGRAGSEFFGFPTHTTVKALVRHSDQRNLRRLDTPSVDEAITVGTAQIVNGDLTGDISGLCEGVDWVIHLAGRTFVDHSIRSAEPFIAANICGTFNLLEDARRHGVKKYIQVSTDEVYGSILTGSYVESAPINPTNPYSASKAGGDALAIAYAHTYGLNTLVTRTENNFGCLQNPQKVFPTFVRKFLAGHKLPVYGDGLHVRQWLWVEDHCHALLQLLAAETTPGEIFHIAGNQELTNLDLARKVLRVLTGIPDLEDIAGYVAFIPDHDIRPGHDRRYALNCDKIQKAIGWRPQVDLDTGIRTAVEWYRANPWWLR